MKISNAKVHSFLSLVLLSSLFTATSAEARARGPEAPFRRGFTTRDGVRLNYARLGSFTSDSNKPIVVSPGRGESMYRYEELTAELLTRGFGPIYILDHRNQGHSSSSIARNDLIHVAKFDDYVTDLSDFIKGPVAADLSAHHVNEKPFLIAHSMGGAIANLALLKEPDLARDVVYIAPMMDLNTGRLNVWNDRPAFWLTQLLCAAGFCDEIALQSSRKIGGKPSPALAREAAEGISREAVSPGWLKEAIQATWSIRRNAGAHRERSLMIVAKRDKTVENPAIHAYACAASNCSVVEIDGPHALHQFRRTKDALVNAITSYFDSCDRELTETK